MFLTPPSCNSQAFWIVATRHTDSPFSNFDSAMLSLFTFMVGDYTPFELPGTSSSTSLDRYLQLLSTIYMLIVAILLLNLLIALMGDSFGTVKTDALAHWALHKAQSKTYLHLLYILTPTNTYLHLPPPCLRSYAHAVCIDVGATANTFLTVSGRQEARTTVLYVRLDSAPVDTNPLDSTTSLEKKVDGLQEENKKILALLEKLVGKNVPAVEA
jgi:hypothetical protein